MPSFLDSEIFPSWSEEKSQVCEAFIIFTCQLLCSYVLALMSNLKQGNLRKPRYSTTYPIRSYVALAFSKQTAPFATHVNGDVIRAIVSCVRVCQNKGSWALDLN